MTLFKQIHLLKTFFFFIPFSYQVGLTGCSYIKCVFLGWITFRYYFNTFLYKQNKISLQKMLKLNTRYSQLDELIILILVVDVIYCCFN